MQDGTAAGMITGRELMVEMQKKREVSHTLVCFDAVSLLLVCQTRRRSSKSEAKLLMQAAAHRLRRSDLQRWARQ